MDYLKLAEKLGVTIVVNTEVSGSFYVADISTIVINGNLSELEFNKVLLHEIGHHIEDKELTHLYNASFVAHSKMEYQANMYMLDILVNEYKNMCDEINFCHFMQLFDISARYEQDVIARFTKLA